MWERASPEDRKGFERLVRYAALPPIATDSLSQLKTLWEIGATHVMFEPQQFMARLAAFIPAPAVPHRHSHDAVAGIPSSLFFGSCSAV